MRHIESGRARAAMVASYQAGPSEPGLAVARRTLDGTLGEPVPVGWGDVDYVLKATGRAGLTAGERAGLGVLATRFPLLG